MSSNMSSSELDLANDEMATTLIPVIVIICVYMLIGLFGNPLVVYYYGCVVAPSPSYYFIVAMAVFDIIICCVSMPLEIIDLRYNYKFPSAAACKILRFVNYFASIGSGLVLIAIATDRYRKVCKPFKRQITTKMAKFIIGLLCISSFCISMPSFVIYDVQTVNISSIDGLTGYDCTSIRKQKYKFYITLYNGVCFLIFIGCITSLTVLYILIGKKLCRLKKFRFSTVTKKYSNQIYSPPTSSSEIESKFKLNDHTITPTRKKQTQSSRKGSNKRTQPYLSYMARIQDSQASNNLRNDLAANTNSIQEIGSKNTLENCTIDSGSDTSSGNIKLHVNPRKKRKKKVHEKYIHLKKYTLLMLSVSMAFVLSFLPYLGLMTWRTLAPKFVEESLSKTELVLFKIFIHSWLIASVVNPIIYGFFNADFSDFIINRLKTICCCCRRDVNDPDFEGTQESAHTG